VRRDREAEPGQELRDATPDPAEADDSGLQRRRQMERTQLCEAPFACARAPIGLEEPANAGEAECHGV